MPGIRGGNQKTPQGKNRGLGAPQLKEEANSYQQSVKGSEPKVSRWVWMTWWRTASFPGGGGELGDVTTRASTTTSVPGLGSLNDKSLLIYVLRNATCIAE